MTRGLVFVAALMALLLSCGDIAHRPHGGTPRVEGRVRARAALALLSYNVEGLPWPLTRGRTEAAERIAAELRRMRAEGREPQIVAVQEAFGRKQKDIGVAAGYRYAAFGPSADMAAAPPRTSGERAFIANGSALHGELGNAWEDSGLAIFSDFPIAWVRRIPFPRFACAGYDCLANKGVLVVALRPPGQAFPIIVVDTHLNSRAASGVSDERSFAAYRRQVDLLSGTIARLRGAAPILLAGDFNVGNDATRGAYLDFAIDGLDRMSVAASETSCGPTCRVVASAPAIERSKTLIFYRRLSAAIGAAHEFGDLPGGGRLSDHVGVMRSFGSKA